MYIHTRSKSYRQRVSSFVPSDIPRSEANALIALYHATDGDNWTTNTGWLEDPVVNNWHGITVSDGRVSEIDLNTNNLVGDLRAFNQTVFPSLEKIYLYGNTITDYYISTALGVDSGNLFAYYPLTENSGATAYEAQGTTALDGTYTNATPGGDRFPDGDPAVSFDGTGDVVDIYSSDFNTAFDGDTGSFVIWYKIPYATWTDSSTRRILHLYTDSNNYIKAEIDGSKSWTIVRKAGGTQNGYSAFDNYHHTQFMMIAMTWDTTADEQKLYINNKQYRATRTGLGSWSGDLHASFACIGASRNNGTACHDGGIAHALFYNGVLSDANIQTLYNAAPYPKNLFTIGDSKSTGEEHTGDYWPILLATELERHTDNRWVERKGHSNRYAQAGWTTSDAASYVDSNLSSEIYTADMAVINLGANDVGSLPAEATWKADYKSIIDDLIAMWPNIEIYLAKVWVQGEGTNCDTVAGWIDDIVGDYANVHVGMDERDWLENGDDGATYTTDGTHYTDSAQSVAVDEWLSGMGVS